MLNEVQMARHRAWTHQNWRGEEDAPNVLEAADLENQRNGSSGMAGGAGAARHLGNATREFKLPEMVDIISHPGLTD